jgi:hypothetical protein
LRISGLAHVRVRVRVRVRARVRVRVRVRVRARVTVRVADQRPCTRGAARRSIASSHRPPAAA